VIGSFASQLWLPSSDIDIMIIIPDGNNPTFFEHIVETFYKKVMYLGYHNSIKLLRTYKLPMIKLILNGQFQNLEVELFLTGKKNIASRYVAYTNEVMQYYP
jgi:DNA polymerase sigma